MSLRDRFAAWSAGREARAQERQRYNAAVQAIRDRDAGALERALDPSPAVNRQFFTGSHFDELIEKTIATDDPGLFRVVLSRLLGGDVNHEFDAGHISFSGRYHHSHKTLLFRTLDAGSEAIALMLIRDSAITSFTLSRSGYEETIPCMGRDFLVSSAGRGEGVYAPAYLPPARMAEARGMGRAVLAIGDKQEELAGRFADDLCAYLARQSRESGPPPAPSRS